MPGVSASQGSRRRTSARTYLVAGVAGDCLVLAEGDLEGRPCYAGTVAADPAQVRLIARLAVPVSRIAFPDGVGPAGQWQPVRLAISVDVVDGAIVTYRPAIGPVERRSA